MSLPRPACCCPSHPRCSFQQALHQYTVRAVCCAPSGQCALQRQHHPPDCMQATGEPHMRFELWFSVLGLPEGQRTLTCLEQSLLLQAVCMQSGEDLVLRACKQNIANSASAASHLLYVHRLQLALILGMPACNNTRHTFICCVRFSAWFQFTIQFHIAKVSVIAVRLSCSNGRNCFKATDHAAYSMPLPFSCCCFVACTCANAVAVFVRPCYFTHCKHRMRYSTIMSL